MHKQFVYKGLISSILIFSFMSNVKAGSNLKYENTTDSGTQNDKCPVSIIVQDNLKGNKDMDYSLLDCIYYKMDDKGNYLYDDYGNKIPRAEDELPNFSCVQKFLDKYSNKEFEEAANNKKDSGFRQIKYCPVYCVEENEFNFPGYAPVTNSGGNFTWTIGKNKDKNIIDGLTVRLHGTKVCRTHVDLDTWTKDYSDVMKKIENLIDKRGPISSGSSNCVNDPHQGIGTAHSFCAFNPTPISTTYHLITANDYNTFKNYKELKQLSGTAAGAMITEATGLTGTLNSLAGVSQSIADASSNRYFVTSRPTSISDNSLDGVFKIFKDGSAYGLVATNFTGVDDMYDFALNGKNSDTTTIKIRVDTWERHCCHWEIDNTGNPSKFYTSGNPGWNINDGIPASITYGFETLATKEGCGLLDGGRTVNTSSLVTGHGLTCCDGINVNRGKTTCYCTASRYIKDDAECEDFGGQWKCSKTPDTYSCKKNTTTYTQYQRYKVKCGTEGTGDDQGIVAAGVSSRCTTSSISTCPSGYSYSPITRQCYRANITEIEKKLGKLLGLIHDIKQCHDSLKDYDYYLDTEMEVEYNETNDSSRNFYFPNKDGVTKTRLVKISENDNENNNENLLGKYSSDIIKPSNKSDYVRYVNFFGNTYKFSKDGIPLVACALSGVRKECTATNNTTLNDYWYDWYAKTYIAMYEYRLDGNFYKWVKLPSGESISTEPVGDYKKYNRFIDIGHANYPVHYSTPKGIYEGLNIRITNVGYKNYLYNTYQTAVKNYNFSLSDKSLVSTEGQNQLLHDCYYEVKEGKPYCPSKGCLESVYLIYRPISLEYPFPAMSGNGRDTGSNWCIINSDKTTDCKNTNENVQKYILNNRNTSGNNVYKKEPMYTITLNPSLIKEIRKYNAQTNYDDFYLYCNGKKGKEGTECKSKFVRGESISVDNMPGDMEVIANNISKHISGCGTEDWDECDKLDNYER